MVLDPSVIVYAGYIGGAGDDVANGIALDSATNTYVVGSTTSKHALDTDSSLVARVLAMEPPRDLLTVADQRII